jgi:hypothetical protein
MILFSASSSFLGNMPKMLRNVPAHTLYDMKLIGEFPDFVFYGRAFTVQT